MFHIDVSQGPQGPDGPAGESGPEGTKVNLNTSVLKTHLCRHVRADFKAFHEPLLLLCSDSYDQFELPEENVLYFFNCRVKKVSWEKKENSDP